MNKIHREFHPTSKKKFVRMKFIKEIKSKIHGVVSLMLLGIATVIGFVVILAENINIAVLYLLVLLAAPFAICYFYCLKCPCRTSNCGHVFPGRFTRVFKPRHTTRYNFFDYFITVLVLLLVLAIPQFWLFTDTILFVIFWSLIVIAGVEARLFVCTVCYNYYCPANNTKSQIQS